MDLGTISVQPILRNDPRAPIRNYTGYTSTPGTTWVLVVGTVVLLVEVVAAAASLAGGA
jgi:hypothetical protein